MASAKASETAGFIAVSFAVDTIDEDALAVNRRGQ
jgi:hypothetical protein